MIINYLLWRLLEFLQVFVYPCILSPFTCFKIWWNPYTNLLPQPAEGIEEVPDIGSPHAHLGSRDDLCEPQEKWILDFCQFWIDWGRNHGFFCLSAIVLIHIQDIPLWFGSHTAFYLEAYCFCSGNWKRMQRPWFGVFLVMVVKAMVRVAVIASSSSFQHCPLLRIGPLINTQSIHRNNGTLFCHQIAVF